MIKIKNKGFTLIEMLVATLILALVSLAIVVGTNGAMQVFKNSLFVSEVQMVSQTLNTAISDVLRYATVDVSEEQLLFSNKSYGVDKGNFTINTDGMLCINPAGGDAADETQLEFLINEGSYADMKIEDFSLNYTGGVFSGSYTIYRAQDKSLKKTVEFSYKSLMYLDMS